MTDFKDFKLIPEISTFTGDKIKIDRVLNTRIQVLAYKVSKSKYEDSGDLLTLQIQKSGQKHVIFTTAKILIQLLEKIPKDKFPFNTTIVRENEYYEFT